MKTLQPVAEALDRLAGSAREFEDRPEGQYAEDGDQVVLESVSLRFEEGQLSGIMGPNGAGKTTCFNVLTGRYRPDRGRVLFAGEDITGLSAREIARRGLSRSPASLRRRSRVRQPWLTQTSSRIFLTRVW